MKALELLENAQEMTLRKDGAKEGARSNTAWSGKTSVNHTRDPKSRLLHPKSSITTSSAPFKVMSPPLTPIDQAVHSLLRRTEPLDSQVPGQGGGGKGEAYQSARATWPEGQAAGPGMPQPKPSEQECESMKTSQEPAPQPGTDVVPAAPRKPRKCSKLVLLTASKDSAKVAAAKRKGVHCIMSLGVPGPATLAKALLKTHPEAQQAIEAPPQEPEQKRSKLDLDADGPEDSGESEVSSSSPEESPVFPEAPSPSP